MKKLIIISLAIISLFAICCKPTKTDPTPTTPPVVVIKMDSVISIKNIQLYNQGLDTLKNNGYKFYNITNRKYSNNVNSAIELAFVYNSFNKSANKHLLGSARAITIKLNHGISNSNNTKVDFYTVKNDGSTLLYDTLLNSKGFDKIFTTTYMQKANVGGESDAIQSDGFGWDVNQLIGFQLANGKRGIIKTINKPSGSIDSQNNLILGNIQFDIKLEK